MKNLTLRKAAKGVVTVGGGVYQIGFNDGDETEFDAYDFCEEEGIETNCVDYVYRV